MAAPTKDKPFAANHLMAALGANQEFRLRVMGNLTTIQQSHNFTGRKLTEDELHALLNEVAFLVEVNVPHLLQYDSAVWNMARRLTAMGLGLKAAPCSDCDGRGEFRATQGGVVVYVEKCATCEGSGVIYRAGAVQPEEAPSELVTAVEALQAIANLPTGATEDVTRGHEDAYRAVEALFQTPPEIERLPNAPSPSGVAEARADVVEFHVTDKKNGIDYTAHGRLRLGAYPEESALPALLALARRVARLHPDVEIGPYTLASLISEATAVVAKVDEELVI